MAQWLGTGIERYWWLYNCLYWLYDDIPIQRNAPVIDSGRCISFTHIFRFFRSRKYGCVCQLCNILCWHGTIHVPSRLPLCRNLQWQHLLTDPFPKDENSPIGNFRWFNRVIQTVSPIFVITPSLPVEKQEMRGMKIEKLFYLNLFPICGWRSFTFFDGTNADAVPVRFREHVTDSLSFGSDAGVTDFVSFYQDGLSGFGTCLRQFFIEGEVTFNHKWEINSNKITFLFSSPSFPVFQQEVRG